MGIQDLGAMGEFISSLVIVITLVVLIYEVRGTKQATQQANALERQRKRDLAYGAMAEAPNLAAIWAKAENHLGNSKFEEQAREFGLEADEWFQLSSYLSRRMAGFLNAFDMDLPEKERNLNDRNIVSVLTASAVFRKDYTAMTSEMAPGDPREAFIRHVDHLLAEQT